MKLKSLIILKSVPGVYFAIVSITRQVAWHLLYIVGARSVA